MWFRRPPRVQCHHLGYHLIVLLIASTTSHSLELVRCGSGLGMESGEIPDSGISASSAYDSASVGPHHGRLRNDRNGGAWCPKAMVTKEGGEWLEVDLGRPSVVSGTRTQGRFGNGQGQEYAEEFLLDYWRPGFTKWRRWRNRKGKQVLEGNTNTYTVVEQKLDPVLVASKVRFVPYSTHVRTVCMRVDVLGCHWQEGVVSYSMPEGDRRSGGLDLRDDSYDGTDEGGWLSGGLGQLVDGFLGQDDFLLDVFGLGKGYEWVGWRNDNFSTNRQPLEMIFEFDKLRNFSAMYLHTNNIYSKQVQVFDEAKVYLSVGGRTYHGPPIKYNYIPDMVLEHARNVTIKLHHKVGRFLKVQLYFASQWIMVSEVSFDSVVVAGELSDEDAENSLLAGVNHPKEVPLQRDAVHTKEETTKTVSSIGSVSSISDSGSGRSSSSSNESSSSSSNGHSTSGQIIGFLIGALTAVILLLMAAITFIVYRQKRHKLGQPQPTDDFHIDKHEEQEKTILYHEPFMNHISLCSFQSANTQPVRPDPDYSEDYAVPLVGGGYLGGGVQSPIRSLPPPPIQDFFPSPPPVPPPPENYYAATEISQKPPLGLSSGGSVAASSSTSSYGHLVTPPNPQRDLGLKEISRRDLKYVSKLGTGHFGEVHLFEWIKSPEWVKPNACKYLAVKVLRKGTSEKLREDFHREVEDLLPLRDENLSRVLGACLEVEPLLLVMEYTENGDLYQFLQNYVAETAGLTTHANVLSYGCLIFMATQVASGMKYLEEQEFIITDLATRNCLVGSDYSVKVAELGIGQSVYPADYCLLPGRGLCPLRWMAWEAVILEQYSMKSTVWSFAVTLWEILTFAREQPFEDLVDEKLIENAKLFDKSNGKPLILPQPYNCQKEIYDLMCECWQKKDSDRPSFKEIHMFLQRKNLGYKATGRKS